MKKVRYFVRGVEFDFKRFGDHEETVLIDRTFKSGGLLYGYKDRFNVVSIPIEDILSIEEV